MEWFFLAKKPYQSSKLSIRRLKKFTIFTCIVFIYQLTE